MTTKVKPTHEQPGGLQDPNVEPDDGVVNDSLGSVDIADSTGLDEDKETGDAKRLNKNPGLLSRGFSIPMHTAYALAVVRSTSFRRAALPRSPRM
jgi:hypothetical protein